MLHVYMYMYNSTPLEPFEDSRNFFSFQKELSVGHVMKGKVFSKSQNTLLRLCLALRWIITILFASPALGYFCVSLTRFCIFSQLGNHKLT